MDQIHAPADGVDPSQKDPPLTLKECAALIGTGAGVEVSVSALEDLMKAKVEPVAVHLHLGQKTLNWESIPRSVRALSISMGSGKLDLSGIQVLSRLEHLEIHNPSISGIEALQGLPKLELLSVIAATESTEIAHLGKLTNLKHLAFIEQCKVTFPEKAFRNCPNLTVADFTGGRVSKERIAELADAGHFKHLRVLRTPSHYPIRNMPNLQLLDTSIYPNGKNFDNLGSLPALRALALEGARNEDLQRLTTLPDIKQIETLVLIQPTTDEFSGLLGMSELNHLIVFSTSGSRADFSALSSLEKMSITSTSSLNELKLPSNLLDLSVSRSDALDFSSITPLPHLRRLSIESCSALKSLTPFASCSELTHLNLKSCRQLETTAGLEKSKNIVHGLIHCCGRLPNWKH